MLRLVDDNSDDTRKTCIPKPFELCSSGSFKAFEFPPQKTRIEIQFFIHFSRSSI